MPKSTILRNSSYAPQKIAIVLPDEKSSAPGELTQCLFFKTHWPVELHNAYSVRTGKQPAQLGQLLPLDQAVKYDFGSHRPPGTTKEIPRTEEHMCKRERKYVTDLREIIIICMFVRGRISDYTCKI